MALSGVTEAAIRVGKKLFSAKIKMPDGSDVFPERTTPNTEWYNRVDSNGWRYVRPSLCSFHRLTTHEPYNTRSVSAKSIEDAKKDPVTMKGNTYKLPYHYSKLKRAKNAALERKNAKRKWLRKLYTQGLANEKDEKQRCANFYLKSSRLPL